jgi:hypothetical protein
MELEEQIARSGELDSAPPSHPEEMKAHVDLRIGERTVLTATARTTPAGLISIGVMVGAILLSVAVLVRAARRPRW